MVIALIIALVLVILMFNARVSFLEKMLCQSRTEMSRVKDKIDVLEDEVGYLRNKLTAKLGG